MARYVTGKRPRANDDWWDEPQRLNLTVDDVKEVDTGLVDPHGNPIFRLPPPIGFGRNDEW